MVEISQVIMATTKAKAKTQAKARAKPYTIKLSTDNGVVFKNQEGETVITPKLYKGGQPFVGGVVWSWTLDGVTTTGLSFRIKALKRLAYPSITYEVDGFIDADIGDTVKVIDEGFVPKLILKARVIEQYIYDDETKNKTVLGNFTALKS